ncbi:hypothetical protein WJX74_009499 [Apatococcus lobatus]|uniref:Condensation domain-containing protein n=1 Tax=Apatococcus lobatus TaxID=904363 RepID=A0AAW1Q9D4_9CHLO
MRMNTREALAVLRQSAAIFFPPPAADFWGNAKMSFCPIKLALRWPAARLPLQSNGPILLQVSSGESLLVLVVHHIIADAWALQLLSTDMNAALEAALELYQSHAGSQAKLEQPAVTSSSAGRAGAEAHAWWARQLEGCEKLQLIAQYDPINPSDPTTAKACCRVSAASSHLHKQAAALLKTSSFSVMMAAFQITLGSMSRQERFGVWTALGNRTTPELQGLVGDTACEVMVPADLRGQVTYRQVVDRVRRFVMDSQAFGWMPIQKLSELLPPGYDMASGYVGFGMPIVPNKAAITQTLPGGVKAEQVPQELFLQIHQNRQPPQSANTLRDLTIEVFENEAYLAYARRLFNADFPDQLMRTMQASSQCTPRVIIPFV